MLLPCMSPMAEGCRVGAALQVGSYLGNTGRDAIVARAALDLGGVKTKSDLVVMPSEERIFAFFQLPSLLWEREPVVIRLAPTTPLDGKPA
jgi:hypothetical protein